MVCEKMKARWSYNFSNLGPKKQISGTTFYKVAIGKETRWLSMEGINMLAKAKEAGVSQKMVLKQVSNFTGRGTKVRVTRMRSNLMAYLRDLMGTEVMDRVRKGISKMTDLGISNSTSFCASMFRWPKRTDSFDITQLVAWLI